MRKISGKKDHRWTQILNKLIPADKKSNKLSKTEILLMIMEISKKSEHCHPEET